MPKNKVFDVVRLAAKRGEVEEQKWRDSMASHEIDEFIIKSPIQK